MCLLSGHSVKLFIICLLGFQKNIEILLQPVGKYYISSNIPGDLHMEHLNRLAKEAIGLFGL